jgi:hypothetical protein
MSQVLNLRNNILKEQKQAGQLISVTVVESRLAALGNSDENRDCQSKFDVLRSLAHSQVPGQSDLSQINHQFTRMLSGSSPVDSAIKLAKSFDL